MTVITKNKAEKIQEYAFPEFQGTSMAIASKDNEKAVQDALQQAYEAGEAEGYAKAQQKSLEQATIQAEQLFQQQWQKQCQTLNLLMTNITKPIAMIDEAIVQQIKMLLNQLAKKIIQDEIKLDPQKLTTMVHDALALLPVSIQEYRIALNPEDLQLIEEHLSAELRANIVGDSKLVCGDIQLNGVAASIDARLDERLHALVDGAYESQ